MCARSFPELVSALCCSPFFIVSAAVLVPCPEGWPPELGMFPELNNLLNTAPDKVEQVISRAVEKGVVPGAWRKNASGTKCADWRERRVVRRQTAPGSCSPRRADPGLELDNGTRGRWASEPSRVFSEAVGALENS